MAKHLMKMIHGAAITDRVEPSVYHRIANEITSERHVHEIISSVDVEDEQITMVAVTVLSMTDTLLRSYATHALNRLLKENWNRQGRFLDIPPEFGFALLRALAMQEEKPLADTVARRISEYSVGLRRRYGRLVEDDEKRHRGATLLASVKNNDFKGFSLVLARRGHE